MASVDWSLISTHDPEIECWHGGFTVMPESNHIVLNDVMKMKGKTGRVIKIFKVDGAQLRLHTSVKVIYSVYLHTYLMLRK